VNSIFACGEALMDMVPTPTTAGCSFRPVPGGCPYNSAIAAARAGGSVHFIGNISTDFFGDKLVEQLSSNDVGLDHVTRSGRPTTLAFVDLQAGEARYAFYNNASANVNLRPPVAGSIGASGDILLVGSISLIKSPASDRIADFAVKSANHMTLAIDPNVRSGMISDRRTWSARMERLFGVASIVRLSDEDLDFVRPGLSAEDFAADLLAGSAALVVVTRGKEGSEAFARNCRVKVRAPQIEVVDTVGAGDTLIGSLLAWLCGHDISTRKALASIDRDALHSLMTFATHAAALNCTRNGCNPPTREEILSFQAKVDS